MITLGLRGASDEQVRELVTEIAHIYMNGDYRSPRAAMKPMEEAYADTSGNPIYAKTPPRIVKGSYGHWSSLSKATHWMPLPLPLRPHGDAATGETVTKRQARRIAHQIVKAA